MLIIYTTYLQTFLCSKLLKVGNTSFVLRTTVRRIYFLSSFKRPCNLKQEDSDDFIRVRSCSQLSPLSAESQTSQMKKLCRCHISNQDKTLLATKYLSKLT